MAETSRIWPYTRAIGKALTIPGTNIGLGILADIQDQLSADESHRQLIEALDAIRGDTAASLRLLLEKEGIKLTARDLSEGALRLAEAAYLKQVADEYFYADFKGIEQMEKLVPRELDEVFVNLRVRAERPSGERERAERDRLRRLEASDPTRPERVEEQLAELDAHRFGSTKDAGAAQSIDRVLASGRGLVLLGGPGSGKTTLVKRLARSCALGGDVLAERYPNLPWCFPVVLPVALLAESAGDGDLFEFVKARLAERGGDCLVQVFVDRWAAGQCLLLLDGLDEIAAAASREANKVVISICERLGTLTNETVATGLARSLEAMRCVDPNPSAVAALSALTTHIDWKVRLEAARMLSRAASQDPNAVTCLAKLLARDEDPDVRAQAALCLWRAGRRTDMTIPSAIAYGLNGEDATMRDGPEPGLTTALLELLEHEDVGIRCPAAALLGQWGHQAEAMPVVLKLMEDEDASFRRWAADGLGEWGSDAETAEWVLSKLLQDDPGPAVKYVDTSIEPGMRPPDMEARRLLAKALEPDQDDSDFVRALRGVVFRWVWKASP